MGADATATGWAARRAVCWLALSLLLTALLAGGCTDLALSKYRDDRLLDEYRYALGEQYIEIDGLRLCYQEVGAGPTVIILPGLGTSIDFWQRNLPALAEHFHVLALDLPGFGKSDKPDVAYDLRWTCGRIRAFMDARGVERASFVGGSMGGHLALLMALEHPERVERVVLMGSTGAWRPPGVLLDAAIQLVWNDALVTDYLRGRWPAIYRSLFVQQTELTETLLRYQMARRARPGEYRAEGRASSRALRSIVYSSCRSRLGEVTVPVLLVWGASDRIHPVADGAYMQAHLPDARLVVIEGASHEAMLDQPEAFNDAVAAFLSAGTAPHPTTRVVGVAPAGAPVSAPVSAGTGPGHMD
jgi:pimeloyl-ACP methyl ester carboxylesterase